MKDVNAIAKRALEYKEKGLSEKEIADELHLSPETVTWLLTRGVKGGEPPKDVKIGWRSIGVYGNRIGFMASQSTGFPSRRGSARSSARSSSSIVRARSATARVARTRRTTHPRK